MTEEPQGAPFLFPISGEASDRGLTTITYQFT